MPLTFEKEVDGYSSEDDQDKQYEWHMRNLNNTLVACNAALISIDIQIKRNKRNSMVVEALEARKRNMLNTMRAFLQLVHKKSSSVCIDG